LKKAFVSIKILYPLMIILYMKFMDKKQNILIGFFINKNRAVLVNLIKEQITARLLSI